MEEMISIPRRELKELEDNSAFLDALYAAGVDNWEGYERAQEIMEENN